LKHFSGNPIKDSKYSKPTLPVGGKKEKWKIKSKLGENSLTAQPQIGEGMVKREYDVKNIINVGESRSFIDDSKLIISLHIDRTKYETHEELYHAIRNWWVDTKGRSQSTVIDRIRNARIMQKHALYPVDWLKFEPEQIVNQLLYRQKYEYKELAETTGNPTYGATQLTNLWKTVNMFAEAYGLDISYWGWNPPTPPEPQVKIVPRPEIVNRLMHTWYTNDRFENALIRTLLTVGFHIGLRPEELITIKASDVKLNDGYIFIREQKKKYGERQVWIDESVMNSRRQNSLKNWVKIWRPKAANEKSKDFLFIQKNGSPFPSEHALRMYLMPFVKPVWSEFCPKIMRDWSAIARLIRTKIETKKWDIRNVKYDLGHKYEKTTESYVRYAENYYRKDPHDWLRAVLKFHKNSLRMKHLMKQEYGSCQEISKISINTKKVSQSRWFSPVELYGPGGIRTRDLQLRRLPPNPG
jgi:integrase